MMWPVGFFVRCSSALLGPGALESAGRGSLAPHPANGCRGLLVSSSCGPIPMGWTWLREMAWFSLSVVVTYTAFGPSTVLRWIPGSEVGYRGGG